jgi:hypothetical protein
MLHPNLVGFKDTPAGTCAQRKITRVPRTGNCQASVQERPRRGRHRPALGNGDPIPNATALGSAWMTRIVSSIVNTVFYIHPRSGAHWREKPETNLDLRVGGAITPLSSRSRIQSSIVKVGEYVAR